MESLQTDSRAGRMERVTHTINDLLDQRDDLLEALKDLRGVVKQDLLPNVKGDVYLANAIRVEGAFEQVDAAIRKAEGDDDGV